MHWAERAGFDRPVDAYLALAENAVDSRSFHPSDIVESRAGTRVEIHNTDAEGRLVLADALDVAATQEGVDKPAAIIDVATLTGAIKVALGTEISGLFASDDALAEAFEGAGQAMGDLTWRMPLFAPYKAMLRSGFAEIANACEGFGGAITAALFLEPFARGLPWAHLDVYSWRDSAGAAYSEAGGSGQPTQMLIEAARRIAT
jgi:leucyl aminopeptidase